MSFVRLANQLAYKSIFSLLREIRHYENLLAKNEVFDDYESPYTFMEFQAIKDKLGNLRHELKRYERTKPDLCQAAQYAMSLHSSRYGMWHNRSTKNERLNFWIGHKNYWVAVDDAYVFNFWVLKHLPFEHEALKNWHDVKDLIRRAKRNGRSFGDLAANPELLDDYLAIPF